MKPIFNPNITADLEKLTPAGDFILVKRIPDADRSGLIWIPATARNKEAGLRRGTVVAVGKGDRVFMCLCSECGSVADRVIRMKLEPARIGPDRINYTLGKCHTCGGSFSHSEHAGYAEMNVKPGDEIVYTRSPANDVQIGGDAYTFLHEEQHIVAVIETLEEESDALTAVA